MENWRNGPLAGRSEQTAGVFNKEQAMCCCTYLSETDFTMPTSDSNLNSLLAEVRAATGDDWRIGEWQYTVRRLFSLWFPKFVMQYELYHHVSGPEFQIINFYRPDRGDWSINHVNDASHISAYLYGVLAGVQTKQELPHDPRT